MNCLAARLTCLKKLANIKNTCSRQCFLLKSTQVGTELFLWQRTGHLCAANFSKFETFGTSRIDIKRSKRKGPSAFGNSTRAVFRLHWNTKTRNTPVKYRLAARPASPSSKTEGCCRKTNHRLVTREKRHTRILTEQITGVPLLGDGPQLVGAPGKALVIIPSKLHHLRREEKKTR